MKQKITVRQIVFSAIAIALAILIATVLKFKGPFWFNGGSITLFSMLLITMIGWWYGPLMGIIGALAYALLQFITGPYVLSPLQVILDYPLAFGALGLSGFFWKTKNGLVKGYIAGVLGRLFFHCVSGVVFYTEYIGNFGKDAAAVWASILYNMSYIIPEAVLTLIVISLPPMKKVLGRIKQMAVANTR